jgi:dynein heavy chain
MYVLTEIDELYAMIDECMANLNNILGSRYLKNARSRVEQLNTEILFASETLNDWLTCQKNWIYLENIFSSPDIKKRLPTDSNNFEKVNKFILDQMKRALKMKFIHSVMEKREIGAQFKKNKDILNQIQKALDNYLEEKRGAFPRFYFLSNDELLEILAKANDMQAVNKHIKKCFDNINRLDLGPDPRSVTVEGMISGEGENVPFLKTVSTKNEIEIWLNATQ